MLGMRGYSFIGNRWISNIGNTGTSDIENIEANLKNDTRVKVAKRSHIFGSSASPTTEN